MLKLREDEELLDILAKVGYEGPDTALPAGTGTHAGYALKTRSSRWSSRTSAPRRDFDPTRLLRDEGISAA